MQAKGLKLEVVLPKSPSTGWKTHTHTHLDIIEFFHTSQPLKIPWDGRVSGWFELLT